MTTLFDARAAIVTTLTPLFPALRNVEAHGGRFAEREVPMLLARAPCLLVGALGFDQYQARGTKRFAANVSWAGYCLGSDAGGNDRTELAMETAYALVGQLPGQRWGLNGDCLPPDMTTIAADNLYSGHVNNLRVALWAVTWIQTHIFEEMP